MDLAFDERYEAFRREIVEFLAERGTEAPSLAMLLVSDEKAIAWQQTLIERGYTARTIPKQYGGYGAEPDILETIILDDEFNKAGIARGLSGQGISMLVPTLLEHGSEEQKRRWVPPTIQGRVIWCQGYSEPGAGSDLASLQTSAREDGDDFLVSGQKIWTSTADKADMIFLLVDGLLLRV